MINISGNNASLGIKIEIKDSNGASKKILGHITSFKNEGYNIYGLSFLAHETKPQTEFNAEEIVKIEFEKPKF